jgi:hypothetical protein
MAVTSFLLSADFLAKMISIGRMKRSHVWIVFHFEHCCFPFLCSLSLNDIDEVELYVVGGFGVRQKSSVTLIV